MLAAIRLDPRVSCTSGRAVCETHSTKNIYQTKTLEDEEEDQETFFYLLIETLLMTIIRRQVIRPCNDHYHYVATF